MADPALIAVTKDQWVKVATNVTAGQLHIKDTSPDNYFWTYRMTTNPAPTLRDEGVLMLWGEPGQISFSAGVDIYVWCVGADGRVRLDV
jgi:hypothetical protein